MVNIEEIQKLTPKQLEIIQAVLALFAVMGITKEQLATLPELLESFPTYVSNMNLMAQDLAKLKATLAQYGAPKAKEEEDPTADTSENIRRSFGFDSHNERVAFGEGGIVK